jgi:hypothetical protein
VFTLFLTVLLVVSFVSIFIPSVKAQPLTVEASGAAGCYFTLNDVSLGTSASAYDYVALAVYPSDVVSFQVTPPAGSNFEYWELWVDGVYDSNPTPATNPYTVEIPYYSTYEMKAFFTALPAPTPVPTPTPDPSTYTATANGAGGTFLITDLTTGSYTTGTNTASLSFSSGASLQFSVIPPAGYIFSYWTDAFTTYTTAMLSQTLTSSQTLTAHYIASAGNYQYELHGPYIEDGNIFNGVVNATINYEDLPSVHFVFSGVSGSETTLLLSSPTPITTVTWNITNSNVTRRSYFFSPTTTSGELWLYVPDTNDPMSIINSYSISISDLAGLTNAYAKTTKKKHRTPTT